jgi:hypothetical protein
MAFQTLRHVGTATICAWSWRSGHDNNYSSNEANQKRIWANDCVIFSLVRAAKDRLARNTEKKTQSFAQIW